MATFSIKKWNPMANTSHYRARGIFIEGDAGSYWVGIKFTCDQKGFVVQQICKTITNRGTTTKKRKYWEIFYIGGRMSSINADLFMQAGLGRRSQGKIIQCGHAFFFPYDGDVKFDREGTMKLTDTLKFIFGSHITVDKVKEAAGLPAGYSKPEMNTLQEGPIGIIHKVEMKWGPPPPLNPNSKGYEGMLTETVWRGPRALTRRQPDEILDMNRPDDFSDQNKEEWLIVNP